MKQIVCLAVAVLLATSSFLYADEADDFFSLDEPIIQSTDKAEKAVPKTGKKTKDPKAKSKPVSEGGTSQTPKEEVRDVAYSLIYDSLKDEKINSAKAYKKLIEIQSLNPNSIEANYTIAMLFVFTKGNFYSSVKYFIKCKTIRPDDATILVNIGTVYLLADKYAEALKCYQNAYKSDLQSAVMSHNLNKFLTMVQHRDVTLPDAIRKEFIDFANEVLKKTPAIKSDNAKSWMFEPCSEGYSKEEFKQEWFKFPDYSCYELPMCIVCKGRGKIKCPNKDCQAGKPGKKVTKKHVDTEKDKDNTQTPTVNCTTCNDTGIAVCPLCNGSGFEKASKK